MNDSKIWLKNYPPGVPVNINPELYKNLSDFFAKAFERYAGKLAFSCMGKALKYEEVDVMATQFGAYLRSRGLMPGDKLGIMMPNLLQYPIAIIGAIRAGLIIVNTNPLYTPREMKHQFTDSDVKAILIAENFCDKLEKVIGDTAINTIVVTTIGELLGTVKGSLVNFMVKNVKRAVPKYNLPNTVSFKEALKQGKKFNLVNHDADSDDVVFHQYTGGTTGVAKGAMLTHKNVISNMLQLKSFLEPSLDTSKETVILCPLPLYHIFALTVNFFTGMDIGSNSLLIPNPRDLSTITKAFKNHRINMMTGVNTLYNALANDKEFRKLDFSALDCCSGGGTAVQQAVVNEWYRVTGCNITEGYGLTEASPVVTSNPTGDACQIGTIGMPVPSTEVRIADENDRPLAQGESGELQLKGPQVMKGYYNRPDETAKTFSTDGWLKTGDVAMMKEDGFFKIVDRKKDMILVSGFNVYPNEIEGIVAKHPKVMEAAVIGVPHERTGEAVKLFIVRKEKSLDKDEIIQYCRENLTGYKVPKIVVFKDDLPKSTVGKILRRELREV